MRYYIRDLQYFEKWVCSFNENSAVFWNHLATKLIEITVGPFSL